ncbi:MAG: MarR family winged helix-turn-helix transcriptional regulator [Burkholderiaceae bacterium]
MSIEFERSFCIALRRGARVLTSRYDEVLAPSGLRATMFHLLSQLEDGATPTITRLAEQAGLDRSTLGRNLRVLERAGLVSLDEAEDERARAVTITQLGRDSLAVARPLWRAAQHETAERLGDQVTNLLDILTRLDDKSEVNAPG